MKTRNRRPLSSFAFRMLIALLIGSATTVSAIKASYAETQTNLSDITKMLSGGGYVVYIRHTSTEKDYADQVTAEIGNCSTQRTLSQKGWNEAELIGSAFNLLNIPVGALYSSEYCRAWKTARIAFGNPIKKPGLNFEPAEDFTKEQMATMRAEVLPLISATPAQGSNNVIVGHDDPFEAATGIYPEPQGVAYIIKPLVNGKFEIIGHVKPSDWPAIITGIR